jgi:hypothetical protein
MSGLNQCNRLKAHTLHGTCQGLASDPGERTEEVRECAGCGQTIARNNGYWADQSGRATCPPELNPMSTGSSLDPFHEPGE